MDALEILKKTKMLEVKSKRMEEGSCDNLRNRQLEWLLVSDKVSVRVQDKESGYKKGHFTMIRWPLNQGGNLNIGFQNAQAKNRTARRNINLQS